MATTIAGPDDDVVDFFHDWLQGIANEKNRERAAQVLRWVNDEFPQLGFRLAWNQPMFTNNDTFIVGFSAAAKHMAFSPEHAGMVEFEDRLDAEGISHGTMMARMMWNEEVPWDLLRDMIAFNIKDKEGHPKFWR